MHTLGNRRFFMRSSQGAGKFLFGGPAWYWPKWNRYCPRRDGIPRGVPMKYRALGKTPWKVSEISFGAWAIGAAWGPVDDSESMAALHRAIDLGVNFIDTADVYGDGHSERLIAKLLSERPGEQIVVATKAGRRLPRQTPDGYTRENLASWI
ncbi:MAG: aldo/keto reductase, partial [Planctomycetes bacterium]|nr:aldo/keto reductase [Planctomycetota bacterium]